MFHIKCMNGKAYNEGDNGIFIMEREASELCSNTVKLFLKRARQKQLKIANKLVLLYVVVL